MLHMTVSMTVLVFELQGLQKEEAVEPKERAAERAAEPEEWLAVDETTQQSSTNMHVCITHVEPNKECVVRAHCVIGSHPCVQRLFYVPHNIAGSGGVR